MTRLTKQQRMMYQMGILLGLQLVADTVSAWSMDLVKSLKTNPFDADTMRWLKFVEALHRDIPMDGLLHTMQGIVAEEVEPTEKREEMLDRIFQEATKRGGSDGTV